MKATILDLKQNLNRMETYGQKEWKRENISTVTVLPVREIKKEKSKAR